MSSFIVITGMSGAGRSQSANSLEDMGWFVMDNLPPSLIPRVAKLADSSKSATGADQFALVVGTGHYHNEVVSIIQDLREEVSGLKVLFLNASTDTLVQRYESSRRRHPFDATPGLVEAIESERETLAPVRAISDVVIDTSDLSVHQLRDRMVELFGGIATNGRMRVTVVSFGYMHGMPRDVDIVMDCRFLQNPHWVECLRPLTGRDSAVREYVLENKDAAEFLSRLENLLEMLVPRFVAEGKSYLSIAFGCTGGKHRSVSVVEHFADVLRGWGHSPIVSHRDVNK